MTEPRPAGDPDAGSQPDPTAPMKPSDSYTMPGEAPASGYPSSAGSPPTSGAGAYGPPESGGYEPPPSSGAGGYTAPPSGGAYGAPPTSDAGYTDPSSGTGGYGTPPGYGSGGYPPAGYPAGAMAPAGYASSDEKTWALVAHFGGAAAMFLSGGWLGWVPPLVAMLAKGNVSPTVRAHSVAALNFQLLWSIIGAAGFVLGICGVAIVIGAVFFVLTFAAWVIGTIFGIIAGVKANEGQLYRYPMSVNLVK